MDKFFNRILSAKPIYKKIFKIFTVLVLITSFAIYGITALSKQTKLIPENPLIVSADNNSQVSLSSGYKELIDKNDQKDTNMEKNEQKDIETEEREQKDQKDKNPKQKSSQEDVDSKNDDSLKDNTPKDENTDLDNNLPNIEITKPEDKEEKKSNQYFTTSIINGETVATRNYSFHIKQLEHPYIVKDIQVHLNGSTNDIHNISGDKTTLTNVNLTLAEGNNNIKVSINYEEKDGKTFTVFGDYTVIYEKDAIIINTDLEDKETYQDALTFQARAFQGKQEVPIKVTHNDKVVNGNDSNKYEVNLKEGKNIISIHAEQNEVEASKTYTIVYKKPSLTIETDLKNQTVNTSNFSFTARAFDGKERVNLTIHHNEKSISENEKGEYSVTLIEGENIFVLTAKKGNVKHTETYKVIYSPEVGNGEGQEEDKHAPTITIFDIKDGETIKNATRTFHVKAVSYEGKSLTGGNGVVTATNNGKPISINWSDSSQVSFTVKLENGENNIVVTAKDSEGNTATKKITVYGKVVEEGGVIGTITLSLEATTIGLGKIIPPEKVEIYQGEHASHVIDRVFKKHGITYDYTGTHENGFYLAAIYRNGLVKNPKIPDDLLELLKRDFTRVETDSYDPNSLGEFDFTEGSGWMYSVNGIYPNVGFADYYFKDGDVVRIRFTLALGADIGGGMPGSDYGKEW